MKMSDKNKSLVVMHLTWEFPPNKVGGIASVVEDLSLAQLRSGIVPVVVTCTFDDNNVGYENYKGIHVFRFNTNDIPAEDFPSWTMQMNILMQNSASEIMKEFDVDILHGHDWLVTTAAVSLKHIYRIPLVSTIHAMESGRYGGISGDRQEFIHSLEGRLVFESWKIITNSHFMKKSVCEAFHTPWDKITVVPNAVNRDKINVTDDMLKRRNEIKSKYALDHEKIITYVGRHVWEKGIDVLIGAVPSILLTHPDSKIVIAGNGYYTDTAKKLAWDMGISDKVCFPGFVNENELSELLSVTDCFVVPSRYEPFGVTPLEAMSCNVPVVVSDTGGLSETVEHEITGLKVFPGQSDSIAWGVCRMLSDRDLVKRVKEKAHKKLIDYYNWDNMAKMTVEFYDSVLKEFDKNNWKPNKSIFNK